MPPSWSPGSSQWSNFRFWVQHLAVTWLLLVRKVKCDSPKRSREQFARFTKTTVCGPPLTNIPLSEVSTWQYFSDLCPQGCHLLLVPGTSANITVTGPKKEKKVNLLCQLCKTQRSFLLQVWAASSTLHHCHNDMWFMWAMHCSHDDRESDKCFFFCRRKDLPKKDSERSILECQRM